MRLLLLTLSLLTLLLSPMSTTAADPKGDAPLNNYLGSNPTQRHVVSAAEALQIISAGRNYANSPGASPPQNIAVVDPAGLLVAFLRMDNAYLGSIDISIKKARTVALFNGNFPSQGLYNSSQPGGALFGIEETNGGLVVFGGGVPIFQNGYFIGAVGVSGGSVPQDEAVATAAVHGLSGASSVTPM